MSTRGTISISLEDETIWTIYNHHDSYLEHLGKVLFENYNTKEKVLSLLMHGGSSSINETLEDCQFYHRDFGEPMENIEAESFSNFGELKSANIFEDYNYIFDTKDNSWYWFKWNKTDEMKKLIL